MEHWYRGTQDGLRWRHLWAAKVSSTKQLSSWSAHGLYNAFLGKSEAAAFVDKKHYCDGCDTGEVVWVYIHTFTVVLNPIMVMIK